MNPARASLWMCLELEVHVMFLHLSQWEGNAWRRTAEAFMQARLANARENAKHRSRRNAARRKVDERAAAQQRSWWRKSARKKLAAMAPADYEAMLRRNAEYKRKRRAAAKGER